MKLTACLIVKNERGRFLEPCIRHLLEFCDEVRILDDGSTDDSHEVYGDYLQNDHRPDGRLHVLAHGSSRFFEHEGRRRNEALQWAMQGRPSHLISLDADEFVTDGQAVRRACEQDKGRGVWSLGLEEVWKADERNLWVREDGGWRMQERGIPILWRAPTARLAKTTAWQVADRALACGRSPQMVNRIRALPSGSGLLHFGWCNESERAARHARYVEHDGGRFHRNAHLDSIMWPDSKVRLRRRAWPAGLDRAAILARTTPVAA